MTFLAPVVHMIDVRCLENKENKKKGAEMSGKIAERIMQVLLVGAIGVMGLMVARLRSVEKGDLAPSVNLHDAMRDYQVKKIATERMLVDNIYR